MQYEAFFLDFDGVLADSVEVKTQAFTRLFEPYGVEVVAKVIEHHRNHGGMTRDDKFRHYYTEFLGEPLTEEDLADLCQRFARLVVDEVVHAPEIPGAESFLKEWHDQVPCFVISATPEEEIREIVQRRALDVYFRDVLGSPVSKKDNLEAVLNRYALHPGGCIFFGDAESDYRAARQCKVPFLGILPGPEAPLLKAFRDIVWFRNFNEMQQWLSANRL
ncbi:MAG: HAD family hydrolase [Deltaproteobacteria bacterium]|nr:HAD family hydrolase [Deltaproteobacteria bacterium]MBW2033867.1 HAD family hydrolase [Deltaproteobacteria bacterium]MBW2345402.1 HAD family hydrolase [Deltaproteobacteria bacterium]